MIDLLALAARPDVFGEILSRTGSTPKVQQIISLTLAPAFLLSGIGAIMNVMMTRMVWIANRIDRLDDRISDGRHDAEDPERPWLLRRRLSRTSPPIASLAAAAICVVIALLFVSAYVETRLGTVIVVTWVLTMVLLIVGLAFFFRETRLAARGPR
jgi:hypothetical protein